MGESLVSRFMPSLGGSRGTGQFTRVRWVALPGTAGNYLSIPDSPTLSVTGDIDIRVGMVLPDWTPAADTTLASKYGIAGQRSWGFQVLVGGRIQLYWTSNGTTALALTSTGTPAITNNTAAVIRVAFDVNNGAGGRTATFYYKTTSLGAIDSEALSDTGWTLLDAATSATATSIFDSTTEVQLAGVLSTGIQGSFGAAVIKNGIAGTTVLTVAGQDANPDNTVSTFQARTLQTVTINRNSNPTPATVVTQSA
mgnify:CR=1 FL=1